MCAQYITNMCLYAYFVGFVWFFSYFFSLINITKLWLRMNNCLMQFFEWTQTKGRQINETNENVTFNRNRSKEWLHTGSIFLTEFQTCVRDWCCDALFLLLISDFSIMLKTICDRNWSLTNKPMRCQNAWIVKKMYSILLS